MDGKNLNDYLGSASNGYIVRENSKGRFVEHEGVRDIVQAQIDHLGSLKDILTGLSVGSWAYAGIAANTALPSTVSIGGKLNVPVTVVLATLVTLESRSISADQKHLYQTLLNYYQSGSKSGLYEIKRHTGNMFIPFSDKATYSLYHSDGKHLGTTSGNAVFGF